MMILFGILGATQAAATNLNALVAIRLLLGAAEAGALMRLARLRISGGWVMATYCYLLLIAAINIS